jgi:hypothetical protein
VRFVQNVFTVPHFREPFNLPYQRALIERVARAMPATYIRSQLFHQ